MGTKGQVSPIIEENGTVPTLVDPSLAPPGQHLLVLTTLVDAQQSASWRDLKAPRTEALLRRAERRLPGLRDSLRLAEAATPRTMERYTRNSGGAIYGFDVTPAQYVTGLITDFPNRVRDVLAGH